MRQTPTRLLLLTAGSLLLSGCAAEEITPAAEPTTTSPTADSSASAPTAEATPTAEASPAAAIPADWELADGDGYQIGIPPGWFDASRVLADEDLLDELADELGDVVEDADLRARVGEMIRNEGLDLLAFRVTDVTEDFATNFNIVVQPRGPLDEPEVFLEIAEDLVSSFGGEFIQAEESTAGGLPVVEVSYDLPLPDGTVVKGVQDYLFTDDVIYIATYTATQPDVELWSSVLDTFTPTD